MKYVLTRRLFFFQIKAQTSLYKALVLLLSFGFISVLRELSLIIITITFFASRPLVNHVRLFLRRSAFCFFSISALRRLFFLSPACLWFTMVAGRPRFINTVWHNWAPIPVFGYIT